MTENEEIWKGTGKKEDPYQIHTADELMHLAKNVNYGKDYLNIFFRLDESLDLQNQIWIPIGDDTNRFEGDFNGNQKKINQIVLGGEIFQNGLFGSLGRSSNIYNLSLEGKIQITLNDNMVGLLAGQNQGVIENCSCTATVVVTNAIEKEACVGLLAGSNINGGKIVRCKCTGTFETTTLTESKKSINIGGIVGENNSKEGLSLCVSNSTGKFRNLNAIRAGGIAGVNGALGLISECEVMGEMQYINESHEQKGSVLFTQLQGSSKFTMKQGSDTRTNFSIMSSPADKVDEETPKSDEEKNDSEPIFVVAEGVPLNIRKGDKLKFKKIIFKPRGYVTFVENTALSAEMLTTQAKAILEQNTPGNPIARTHFVIYLGLEPFDSSVQEGINDNGTITVTSEISNTEFDFTVGFTKEWRSLQYN